MQGVTQLYASFADKGKRYTGELLCFNLSSGEVNTQGVECGYFKILCERTGKILIFTLGNRSLREAFYRLMPPIGARLRIKQDGFGTSEAGRIYTKFKVWRMD